MELGAVPVLASVFMTCDSDELDEAVLNTIGNIARDNTAARAVADAGILSKLVSVLHGGQHGDFLRDENKPIQLKKASAEALNTFANNEDQVVAVISAGAVAAFLELLQEDDMEMKELAVSGLGNIARSPEGVDDVVAAGTIPVLVSILKAYVERVEVPQVTDTLVDEDRIYCSVGCDEHLAEVVANTLSVIAKVPDHMPAVIAEDTLQVLVTMVWYCADELREVAAHCLGVIAEVNPHGHAVLQAGAAPALLSMLNDTSIDLKQSASFAISSLTQNHAAAIVELGAVPVLASVFMTCDSDELDQSIMKSIGNIARDNTAAGAVADPGILSKLVSVLQGGQHPTLDSSASALKEVAADVISSIARHPSHTQAVVAAGAIPALKDPLQGGVDQVKQMAAHALSSIACNPLYTGAVANDSELLTLLVSMLQNGNNHEKLAATDTLGVVARNPAYTETVVQAGALPAFMAVLEQGNDDLHDVVSDAIQIIAENQSDYVGPHGSDDSAGYHSSGNDYDSSGSCCNDL